MKKTVIELFAGVGGFRVGLNKIRGFDKEGKAVENGPFTFVWANQWEPSTKIQDAFNCYNTRFKGDNNSNIDISKVDKTSIPDFTLLTGGFPCQDYSVAHTLSKSKGLEGKKGVLWWQINDILKVKKPPFVLLENVDRLLKSPAKQRGRDFGIILRCFEDLGYLVEWRVINAFDYGFSQKRGRTFIFAAHKSTRYYNNLIKKTPKNILFLDGIFAKKFPIKLEEVKLEKIDINKNYSDLVCISNSFFANFYDSGILIKGKIYTIKINPIYEKPITLGDIIQKDVIEEKYFLSDEQIKKYKYLRGSKKILRKDKDGHEYYYSEGSMSEFDSLSLPARTMLTSEGTTNRSTHIILDSNKNKLRILTPLECERINTFPDNWTKTDMNERKRYFMMGNALVCGIVERLGEEINKIIEDED